MIRNFINTYLQDDEKKLAFKLSIAAFFIFTLTLSLIVWMSYIFSYREIKKELREESQNILGIPEARDLFLSDRPSFPDRKNENRKRWPRDFIVINEKHGTIIKNDFLDLSKENIDALYSIRKYIISSITINGKDYLVSKNTVDSNSVLFFRDLSPLQSFHITLLSIAIVASFIGLFIIYALSRYLAKITIEPIKAQSRELEAYSHNVAHELRTPLSIMRSNLELLKIKPENRFIDSTDEEITGMEHIIDSLLFLAKPDGKNNHQSINLVKKTEEIISKYQTEAIITFKSKSKNITKLTNDDLYTRIICNLIENAIKYKSGWEIDIILNNEYISISNSIEKNLSEVEQKNIIKVFYQWDSSRSSTGYGLGLALVNKITTILGWTMDIDTKSKKFIVKIGF